MQKTGVLKRINQGEDSRTQFKENFTNSEQLAAEMTAFSNSNGGYILVGVSDDGGIKDWRKMIFTASTNRFPLQPPNW